MSVVALLTKPIHSILHRERCPLVSSLDKGCSVFVLVMC